MNGEAQTKYVDAARAHGAATDAGDSDKANASYDSILEALQELRALPDQGKSALRLALDDDDPHVQCWAATHLLTLDESKAISSLQKLARLPGLVGLDAAMVMREWKAGRLASS